MELTYEMWEAFWAITRGKLPLRLGRDTLYASPEVAKVLQRSMAGAVVPDPRLRGIEMRLERR